MKYVKRVKKAIRKGAGQIKRRYFKGKGFSRPRLSNIVSDVARLKAMVNSEKKRLDITTALQPVGQLNGATGSGLFITDITPVPGSGSSFQQRTGASIKLHSSHMQFQILQQSAASQGVRLKIQIVQIKGTPFTSLLPFVTQMYDLNTFVLNAGSTVIVDYNSQLKPDSFGTYKILREKRVHIPIDPYTGALQIKTFSLGIKYNRGQGHHVRYYGDTTGISDGQIVMFITADSGNISSSTASTLTGTPVQAVNTGVLMSYDIKHYYYDN